MKRLLFVCLGNICRSPAAEAIMAQYIEQRGLTTRVDIDSAGTSGYHSGRPTDERMAAALVARGYQPTSRSRPVDPTEDFDLFDLIVAMDDSNYDDLQNLAEIYGKPAAKIVKVCDYRQQGTATAVPDPYYGGPKGFDNVIDILEDALTQMADVVATDIATNGVGFQPS